MKWRATTKKITPTPYDKSNIKRWTNITHELMQGLFYGSDKDQAITLGKWQALIDYLVDGGELYVVYKSVNALDGSAGRLTFDSDVTDVGQHISFDTYSVSISNVFKIVFEETSSVDYVEFGRYSIGSKKSPRGISFTFKEPDNLYLTTSSYYLKSIKKADIVYDRYGVQITEGCYVLAALPTNPPSIESGKVTNVTAAGIVWFKKLGSEHIFKGKLRAQSCVVVTPELGDNILMEKLSS